MCVNNGHLRFIWRQQHAQLFYSIIDVESPSPLNCNTTNSRDMIILINAHHRQDAAPLTCIVVVLFLSLLFKVFAVYWVEREGERNVNRLACVAQCMSTVVQSMHNLYMYM